MGDFKRFMGMPFRSKAMLKHTAKSVHHYGMGKKGFSPVDETEMEFRSLRNMIKKARGSISAAELKQKAELKEKKKKALEDIENKVFFQEYIPKYKKELEARKKK